MRDGIHTTLTLQPVAVDTKPVFLVVPVPAGFQQDQAGVADVADIDRLMAISAPSLDVTTDADPCFPARKAANQAAPVMASTPKAAPPAWDISLLSKAQSAALVPWLAAQGFAVPAAVLPMIKAAQRKHMDFVEARVTPTTPGLLAPLRIGFDSKDFSVSLGIGGDVTLLVLTRGGQAVVAGRSTRTMPAGTGLPEYVTEQFSHAYTAAIAHQLDLTPQAAIEDYAGPVTMQGGAFFLTRLNLRAENGQYLRLREEKDRTLFTVHYPVRVAWKGLYTLACTKGFDYRHAMATRWLDENAALAGLTGWSPTDIRASMVAHWSRLQETPPVTE